MTLEIITPQSIVFKGEVDSITLPGDLGQFQVLNNHAPILSTLKAGEIKIKKQKDYSTFKITSGVFEFSNNKANILLESVVTEE